jgi:cysteinyl-tRNA synthetase
VSLFKTNKLGYNSRTFRTFMSIHLYNTLTRKKEILVPITPEKIGLYTCGPTVYNYVHIGNLRTYIFEDVLKRVLKYNGYKVNHVMNITDVGHLTSDADEGEDKMEKGSLREGKTAWEIAEFYTKAFKKDLVELNIEEPNIWCKATDNIPEQIGLIEEIEKNGFTYRTSDGIYFDTSKLDDYGKLAGFKKTELKAGARVEMGEKKNPTDFALWKFSTADKKRQMEWPSPWGVGFPGWHIECSAMAAKYLGIPFDIHCGGIDHISVHHTNEIAQTEAASGKLLANMWMHGEFLLINKDKMAKSGDNFITVETLKQKKFSPLAYRFLLLQTHYRQQLNFSFEALEAAQNGLKHLYQSAKNITTETLESDKEVKEEFFGYINDDLNFPEALAFVWEKIKQQSLSLDMLFEFDEVLGLEIKKNISYTTSIPEEIIFFLGERNKARLEKNYAKSDEFRRKIEELGYEVKDTKNGQEVTKK